MGDSIAFWKGVRLWQNAGTLRAQPQANAQPKAGASRARARLDNRGPNVVYQLTVNCWQPPIAGDHTDSKPLLTGRGKQVTRQVYAAKTLELFCDNQGGDKGLGQLAWVEDSDNYRTVTVGGVGGAAFDITTGAAPSAWVPVVGQYVVLANPATGEGFVSPVIAYGTGTLRINAQVYTNDRTPATGEPTLVDQAITTAWRVYECAYYYDKVKFLAMGDPPPGSAGEDRWSPNISYSFMSETGIIYPATYTLDFN